MLPVISKNKVTMYFLNTVDSSTVESILIEGYLFLSTVESTWIEGYLFLRIWLVKVACPQNVEINKKTYFYDLYGYLTK